MLYFIIVKLLLHLIWKLNCIIDIYLKEKTQARHDRTPVVSALRPKQEDHKFLASLESIARTCLNNLNTIYIKPFKVSGSHGRVS